jgi:hypothetical protein
METDYCDAEGYPAKGDTLEVIEQVLDDDGYLDYYLCSWNGLILDIYPYECQELPEGLQ